MICNKRVHNHTKQTWIGVLILLYSPRADITNGRYNVLARKMAGHMVISQKYDPRRIEFVLFKTKFGKVG